MADEYRSLTLRGAQDGALRTATFRGRTHTVVPVVALMEGVVHAVNAAEPELVLATELQRTASAWNGEPVMLDHPEKNGKKVSANDPEILDASQVGQVFNARMSDTRLLMDAYLDPSRADVVGEQARTLLTALEAGGTVEVSVGAFITIEKTSGVDGNGRRYAGIWRDIVPDHLALLPDGSTGACSVDSGCGAGVARAASKHLVTAEGLVPEGETMPDAPIPQLGRSLRERISSMFTFRTEAGAVEDMSDQDLRRTLDTALRATEPAYLGIESVFPGESTVIYAVAPEEKVQFFKRTYELTDAKDVSFDGERVEVEPVTRYEPVMAAAASAAAQGSTSCGCHSQQQSALSAEEKHVTVHKNAERITALIANAKTPWTEHDRVHLEGQSDERLAALESAAVAEPPAPVKPEITLADLPEGWRKAIEAQAALELSEKSTSIEALAAAQTVFTKAELEAMPLDQIKKMATLAGQPAPTTFAARQSAIRSAAGDAGAPPPPDMNAALRAAAAKRQ